MSGIHRATMKEFEGFNHIWAAIGYALGIDDDYIIPLQSGGLEAVRAYYQEIYE